MKPTPAKPAAPQPAPVSQELRVRLLKTNRTSDHAVTIGVDSAIGNTDLNDTRHSFGGGGQTGGGTVVIPDDLVGASSSGLVD